jgi:hypothetical protein
MRCLLHHAARACPNIVLSVYYLFYSIGDTVDSVVRFVLPKRGKMTLNTPNCHKIYQMTITSTKWPKNIHTKLFHFKTLQNFPNWDFWCEDIPSGNPDCGFSYINAWKQVTADAIGHVFLSLLHFNFVPVQKQSYCQLQKSCLKSFFFVCFTQNQTVTMCNSV